MSITPKNKSSKTVSERERFIGFVYVLTLFIVITGACGFILFKYAGTRHIFSNKDGAAKGISKHTICTDCKRRYPIFTY